MAFRKLQHQNVSKFLGAIILKDRGAPESSRVALVMEVCQKNLRDVIFNGDFVCPAKGGSTSAVLRFLNWASEIAGALAHIHELKLIHKHVILENILVSTYFHFQCGWDKCQLADWLIINLLMN